MTFRVLFDGAVLARNLSKAEAEALIENSIAYRNGHGKAVAHLQRRDAYAIVSDDGPVPNSRFKTGYSDWPHMEALNADLSVWCARLDRMQRGPFGPFR